MLTLLIVDDNLSDREGIKANVDWQRLGVRVAGMAANGLEGCRKAAELVPDIVLTDVSMPLMDGIKMAETIQQKQPSVKFVFMSCFDEFNYVKHALDLDAYGYVLKPINLDELTETISKAVRTILEERERSLAEQQLKQQIEDNLPILREQFFCELLYNPTSDANEIRDKMRYLGIGDLQSFYTIVYFQLDRYESLTASKPVEQSYLLGQGLKNAVNDTLLAAHRGYIIHQQHHAVTCIVFPAPDTEEEALSGLLDSLERCKDAVSTQLQASVTIGIGEFSLSIAEIASVRERAVHAVKSKFYSDGNAIILSSEVKRLDEPMDYDLQGIRERLAHVMEQGEAGDVAAFIDECYRPHLRYPESYLKSLTFSMLHMMQTILIEKNEASLFAAYFPSVWDKVSGFETMAELKQWLFPLLDGVRERLNARDGGKYYKIVEDIRRLIDDNFARYDNIEQIVKPLHISASHANYIFRKYAGCTIFDYWIKAKMEAAKRMLADPYVKIYEVADRVGYKSKSYFGAVFKQYTGLTPKQFMEKTAAPDGKTK